MASYKIDGFKFNRANLDGMDADLIASINRHLCARERALNTFEPSSFICEGGPLDGQTIQLCGDGAALELKSAPMMLGDWVGYYHGASWCGNQGTPRATVATSDTSEASTKPAKDASLGRGFEALADLFAEMAEDPEARAIISTKSVSTSWTYGHTDDFGNAIEAQHIPGVTIIKTEYVQQYHAGMHRASRGKVRTIAQKVAIFSPWCGVDDFGNVYDIKATTGHHGGTGFAIIETKKATYTIGRTSYTVAATVQAVDTLKARILKAKRWFSDKMLKAAPLRTVKPADAQLDAIARQDVAQVIAAATTAATIEAAQSTTTDKATVQGMAIAQTIRDNINATTENNATRARMYLSQAARISKASEAMHHRAGHATISEAYQHASDILSAWGQTTTATATAPRELATVGGDNGDACSHTPTTFTPSAPYGQAASTGGHTPKVVQKQSTNNTAPGYGGFDGLPPSEPGNTIAPAAADVYDHAISTQVHYATPVQTIGRHQWRIEVFTCTTVYQKPGVYTRMVWRYIDGPTTREQTRRDNWDWKPMKWTATRGTWYDEHAWPTYDSNRGCDGGLPLTLIKVYNTFKADIEAAIADPYASDAPDFAPIPPNNPATRPDFGQASGPGTPSKSNPKPSTGQMQPHAPPLQKQSTPLQPDNSGPPDIFDMAHPDNITCAELQTLREACGLSRDELAQLVGVQARTVKHWENGRAGVPGDVAKMVTNIDNMIEQATEQARQAIVLAHAANTLGDVVLLRYQTDQHLHTYRPDMATMPASVHGAIIARVRAIVRSMPHGNGQPRPVRVVWMQPDIYEPWRTACHLPDSEATRSQWAAQQVPIQAIPHRGDQP